MNKENSLDSIQGLSKEYVLNYIKKKYFEKIDYIGAKKEKNIFSWKNNFLEITIILISDEYSNEHMQYTGVLFYARVIDSDKDKIKILDLRDSTTGYKFLHKLHSNGKLAISRLKELKIFPDNTESILSSSIVLINMMLLNDDYTMKLILNTYVRSFTDTEYDKTDSQLQKNGTEQFNEQLFFANKFDFATVVETINDDQFTRELNECLWAYNNGKWFICATGIGSVIEHLMMLTVLNYKSPSMLRAVGRTPTAVNYINAFKKEPLFINVREEQYIRTLFQIRNCVDHYHTGYTNKDFVDTLLSGIRNMFNEYYLKSLEYKKEHNTK